jgi:CheY-like chemotaxis protein
MLDILYVEDNQDEVDVFRRVMGRLANPPTFTILSSGSEAIEYLLHQGAYQGQSPPTPRLALIDLNLPGHSGFEIIQQVRAASRTRYLPVIVYSSSDKPEDIRRAYDLGANAYLIKPGSYHGVTDMMRRAIDFWLALSQNV